MRDSEGKFIGVLSIARDITERRRREREVQSWMRRFAIVNATAKHLFYDFDRETDRLTWSGPLNAVLGLRDGDLDGAPDAWKSRLHPQDAPRLLKALDAVRARGGEFECDYRLRHADGHYIHVHASGVYLQNPKGETVRMLGVLQDISARKHAERALALSERKLQMLFAAAHDCILVLQDGRIADCNTSATKLLQRSREEIIGRSPADFSPPLQPDGENSGEALRGRLEQARASGMYSTEPV